ncbi:uncharacterized protein LOC134847020 [Symsagittifera roscoffensis]|uniref:uncharacterized protein LOC134847020 n=1 Tax=Symsagittifera roscoffensis TaxID=84072 RepID=UPI00307C35BC
MLIVCVVITAVFLQKPSFFRLIMESNLDPTDQISSNEMSQTTANDRNENYAQTNNQQSSSASWPQSTANVSNSFNCPHIADSTYSNRREQSRQNSSVGLTASSFMQTDETHRLNQQGSAFGQSGQTSGFGQSGQTSAFGQSEQRSAFGQSGQTSAFGQSEQRSAFGQTGQTSAFGQSGQTSGFGQPRHTSGFGSFSASTFSPNSVGGFTSVTTGVESSNTNSNRNRRHNGRRHTTSNFSSANNQRLFFGPVEDDEEDEDGTLILMNGNRPDAPPNSRLFVICAKTVQKQQLKNFFVSYGDVKQVYLIKDKQSNQNKGCAFVTFASSYAALRALEAVSDFKPKLGNKNLKARLAQDLDKAGDSIQSEGQSKSKSSPNITEESEERKYLEKLSKIRVSIHSSDSEESLSAYFSAFGKIEFVNILRNKDSIRSKGVAVIKFERASFAANAIENNKQIRFHPVIASTSNLCDSAAPSTATRVPTSGEECTNGEVSTVADVSLNREERMMAAAIWGLPQRDMIVRYDRSLTDVQLFKLLDIVPGLEDIKLESAPGTLSQVQEQSETKCCYPRFKTPLNALYAREKLNGFEYPLGKFINVSFKSTVMNNDGVMALANERVSNSSDNCWPSECIQNEPNVQSANNLSNFGDILIRKEGADCSVAAYQHGNYFEEQSEKSYGGEGDGAGGWGSQNGDYDCIEPSLDEDEYYHPGEGDDEEDHFTFGDNTTNSIQSANSSPSGGVVLVSNEELLRNSASNGRNMNWYPLQQATNATAKQ